MKKLTLLNLQTNYKNIQGALLPFLIEKKAIVKKFFINFYIIYFKK